MNPIRVVATNHVTGCGYNPNSNAFDLPASADQYLLTETQALLLSHTHANVELTRYRMQPIVATRATYHVSFPCETAGHRKAMAELDIRGVILQAVTRQLESRTATADLPIDVSSE
jgi:hypothetical protein